MRRSYAFHAISNRLQCSLTHYNCISLVQEADVAKSICAALHQDARGGTEHIRHDIELSLLGASTTVQCPLSVLSASLASVSFVRYCSASMVASMEEEDSPTSCRP